MRSVMETHFFSTPRVPHDHCFTWYDLDQDKKLWLRINTNKPSPSSVNWVYDELMITISPSTRGKQSDFTVRVSTACDDLNDSSACVDLTVCKFSESRDTQLCMSGKLEAETIIKPRLVSIYTVFFLWQGLKNKCFLWLIIFFTSALQEFPSLWQIFPSVSVSVPLLFYLVRPPELNRFS